MYTSFIRPQLEYASVVWGGCYANDSEKLEKLQLHAARIVTGLTIFASRESLYFETGWEPLNVRRKTQRLNTMYKIHNNLVPDYLSDIVPDMRCNASAYHTRNSQDYNIPVCRLQIYISFVPTVVNEWNSLPLDTRDSSSLSLFKNKTSKSLTVAPPYFSNGKRSTNIIHTRLRHNCELNIDLHRCNIISSPLCSCGMIKDTHHFFFSCPKYATVREEFFNKFLRVDKIHILDSRTLLWGDDSLSVDDNKYLFSIVQIYIQGTGRFE